MCLIATCHCGATKIELPHLPTSIKTCNCTYCSRTGAVWGYFGEGELKFLANDGERTYAPSGLNSHHFCGNCGMQTWGDTPDWPSLYNNDGTPKDGGDGSGMPTVRSYHVNLKLIDDLDFATLEIEHVDGRNSW